MESKHQIKQVNFKSNAMLATGVLTTSFLPENNDKLDVPSTDMKELFNKIWECMMEEMKKAFSSQLNAMIPYIAKSLQNQFADAKPELHTSIQDFPDNDSWKHLVYLMLDTHLINMPNLTRRQALLEIYEKMETNYCFCKEQCRKEYKLKNDKKGYVPIIEIIASDPYWRSIFIKILSEKLCEDASKQSKPLKLGHKKELSLADKMQQLIIIRNDKSPNGARTYKCVYENMMPLSKWKDYNAMYKRLLKKSNLTKKDLIETDKELLRLYKQTIDELLLKSEKENAVAQ